MVPSLRGVDGVDGTTASFFVKAAFRKEKEDIEEEEEDIEEEEEEEDANIRWTYREYGLSSDGSSSGSRRRKRRRKKKKLLRGGTRSRKPGHFSASLLPLRSCSVSGSRLRST